MADKTFLKQPESALPESGPLGALPANGQKAHLDAELQALRARITELEASAERHLAETRRSEEALHESEERFNAIIQSVSEAIVVADSGGKIVTWSQGAAKIFGYSEAEATGQPLTMLMPERYRTAHQAGIHRINSGGETHVIGKTVELFGLRKDGAEFPLELSLATWATKQGTVFGGILRDATERKRAEEQLHLQITGLEAAANGIAITDRRGVLLWVNPAFTTLTGYTADEVVGENPRVLKSGQQGAAFYQEMWQTILAGRVWRNEVINRRKDGSLYTEEMTITPVRDANGEITHFIAIKQDITERKEAEAAQAKRAAELEAVARVSTVAATILDTREMLRTASDLTKESFDFYHAHVYLLNEAGDALVLAAGAGEVGRRMAAEGRSIPVNHEHSLVARAARARQGVISNDVSQEPDFLPNPLLPETRSEMAVPMVVGDKLVGVFDVQASTVNRFTGEDLRIEAALANQVAVAVENARSFERSEKALKELNAVARQLTLEGWGAYLNPATRPELGYVYDLTQTLPLAGKAGTGDGEAETLAQPITVRGEVIGRLEIADIRNEDVEAGEVVAAIAEQLSAHLETLRLSEQTQAALGEAEQAHREAERRATELAAINRVVAVAASSFNLQAILGATASEIVEVLKARNSGIALLDESRQNLTVIADHNVSPDEASAVGVNIPLANNPSSTQVIETRRSLVIANAQTDPLTEPIHALLRERQTQCLMIVPLLARGEAIGTIGVDTTDPDRTFTPAEVSLVETIAGQLAGAIENVHLFEEVERHGTELRALFAAMTDVVLVYDKEGRYVRIAPTNPSLLYKLPEDMVGKTIYEVMPRAKADELFAYIQQALETRQSVNAEYQLDIGGASLWFFATVTPLGEDKVFWIARDITERKQAENALAKHAVELETVARVSTAASSVLQVEALLQEVVDLTRSSFNLYHAHIYLLNEAGDMLALSAGAGNVGKKMVEIGRRIPFNHDRSLVARAARTRRGVVANDVTLEPDFLPNPLLPQTRSEMAVPMVVGDKLLGVFDVQSDVANRFTDDDLRIQVTLAGQVAVALQNARLYAEQTATVARLRELDQLKSSFLANMSHELRTPLNSILGFTEVLLEGIDGDLTDRMDNDLKVIYKNGQHLLTLINDILDMAKIEAGKMTLTTERFNLQEVLEEVAALAMPLAQNKALELRLETGINDYLEVEADRIRLRQVMINLVNNAIKFTETGWVSINARLTGAHMLISIHDTGVGIPSGQLETIFQEFHQVDSSTTRKAGGTGLGLPISRHLIELHNGRLWAESSGKSGPEGGSAFFVELPAQSSYDPNAER